MNQTKKNAIIVGALFILIIGIIMQNPQLHNRTSAVIANIELKVLCLENWQCLDFGPCERVRFNQGIQTRTCIDLKHCGSAFNKPETEKTCSIRGSRSFPPIETPAIEVIESIEPKPGEELSVDQINEIRNSIEIDIDAISLEAISLETISLEDIDILSAEELSLVSSISPLVAFRLKITNKGKKTLRAISFEISDREEDPYFPLYVSKVIKFPENFKKGVWPSTQGINGHLLRSIMIDSTYFDIIKPDEAQERDVRLRAGVSINDIRPMLAEYFSFNQKIGEKKLDVTIERPSYGLAVQHLPEDNKFDLYVILSGEQEEQQKAAQDLITGAATMPFIQGEELNIDLAMNRGSRKGYNPRLSLLGLFESIKRGPSSIYAENMGPYFIQKGEKFLLVQQMNYDPSFIENDNFTIAINVLNLNESVHKEQRDIITSN